MWSASASVEEIYENASSDLAQVFYAFHLKSLLALPASLMVHYATTDVTVLYIYLVIMILDLIAGVIRAIKTKTFHPKYVNRWFLKLGAQMFVIFLCGITYYAFFLVSNISLPILSYLKFVLLITESVSLVNNVSKIGLPVPPIVRYMLKLVRRSAVHSVVKGLELPEEDPLAKVESKAEAEGEPAPEPAPEPETSPEENQS
ncbi:MAG: phage holin family protein [Deltaproteobacteria bacterium]|jgi:phage-related holin|nr:phage holin family protein [Deltaproteobacteria bacterium]